MKTGIYKFEKSGMIIDATDGNLENPLIWRTDHWERPNAPCKPVDLSKGVEMTTDELFKARIYKPKSAQFEEEAKPEQKTPSAGEKKTSASPKATLR
nr:hypothetical protein 20 [bacterium]